MAIELIFSSWKREASGEWDGGYQHTGYFLEWLEQKFGPGTVRSVNKCLSKGEYNDDLFKKCCEGNSVKRLWEMYRESLESDKDREDNKSAPKQEIKSCS